MTLPTSWSSAKAWREFFDLLGDAVMVLDTGARIAFANTAALRLLPCDVGAPLQDLEPMLGGPAIRWLERAARGQPAATVPTPMARLADGRSAALAWRRLDPKHSALRIFPDPDARAAAPPCLPDGGPGDAVTAFRLFWDAPFPATVQGGDFRFIDVNPAFEAFTGYGREQLVGRDPLDFLPEGERAGHRAARRDLQAGFGRTPAALGEGCLVDASGRERSYRIARRLLVDATGGITHLALLQDTTAERLARERAERSVRELDDWFDISPVGMVLFDHSGLLVRTNPVFDGLIGRVPVMLKDATPALQQLLGWGTEAPIHGLQPGGRPLECHGGSVAADGEARRLRALVRCYQTPGGQRRYMAVVEDRSAEEERDLAQLQIGALMDTAGVGIATFQESSGWTRQAPATHAAALPASPAAASAALQSISREIVAPESLAEYERLQLALRRAERAEVRYAIDHAELGRRWLLTRVEPGTLASGKRTTSVVTLDVTEQQRSQLRSEQLLREMTTILESTTAGIAYLRDQALVRCNRRFESMLGLVAGTAPGTTIEQLFARQAEAGRVAVEGLPALGQGSVYETEFEFAGGDPAEGRRWYSLSVRRAVAGSEPNESIAVLTDVTRMKTQQIELETLARDRELMFSLSDVGIVFVRDGRIQRANAAMAELTGRPVTELSSIRLAELFIDDDFDPRWGQEDRDMRDEGRWSGERQLRRPDGRLVWVQASKRRVDPGEPSAGIIASYVDVDARHRAERAVALQAERTRSILDSVLVGIVNVGPQGIEWMNRSARRMFAGSLGDFVGEPLSVVATAEPDHPFRRTEYLDDLVEGKAQTFECRVCARDGREFWVVGNAVATARDSRGRQLTYALLDIERRRQAEAQMSAAQSALQQVIEAAPLAIALLDAQSFQVMQANDVAAVAVGLTAQALVGLPPEAIFPRGVAAARRRDLKKAVATSGVTTREYRIGGDAAAKTPTRVWDARYVPLAAAPGQAADRLLLVASDVTEQRAAQEARFDAAIAQREMLVKEVHHRIKNNLQGVAGLLQQIAERKPEVASVISEVIGQVHAIAQVYGLQVGEQGPLRVVGVVEAITASVQRNFGRPIGCTVVGSSPVEWVLPEAEAIPIALTLNELLTNAVKHSVSRTAVGAIGCEVACDEQGVAVTISNPGRLPRGFSVTSIRGGVSGLGLVRALLPRRHATLAIEQKGACVVTSVVLRPPVLARGPSIVSRTIAADAVAAGRPGAEP